MKKFFIASIVIIGCLIIASMIPTSPFRSFIIPDMVGVNPYVKDNDFILRITRRAPMHDCTYVSDLKHESSYKNNTLYVTIKGFYYHESNKLYIGGCTRDVKISVSEIPIGISRFDVDNSMEVIINLQGEENVYLLSMQDDASDRYVNFEAIKISNVLPEPIPYVHKYHDLFDKTGELPPEVSKVKSIKLPKQ